MCGAVFGMRLGKTKVLIFVSCFQILGIFRIFQMMIFAISSFGIFRIFQITEPDLVPERDGSKVLAISN